MQVRLACLLLRHSPRTRKGAGHTPDPSPGRGPCAVAGSSPGARSVISHQKSGELLAQLHPAIQSLVASLPDTLPLEVVVFRGRMVTRQIVINSVKVGHYDDPHSRSAWQLSASPGSVILGTPVWGGPKSECRVLASLKEVSASVEAGRALDCALQPVPEKKKPVEALVRLRIR